MNWSVRSRRRSRSESQSSRKSQCPSHYELPENEKFNTISHSHAHKSKSASAGWRQATRGNAVVEKLSKLLFWNLFSQIPTNFIGDYTLP